MGSEGQRVRSTGPDYPAELAETQVVVFGCIIFTLTWLLVAFERVPFLPIGRTAGALLGGCLMVATGVLTSEEAFQSVDFGTLSLLFWTMVILLTPVVLQICREHGFPYQTLLLALASSANIGSAATPIGNPQNMIISNMGDISFLYFLMHLLPAVIAAMLVNIALLLLYYWHRLSSPELAHDSTFGWCCYRFGKSEPKAQSNTRVEEGGRDNNLSLDRDGAISPDILAIDSREPMTADTDMSFTYEGSKGNVCAFDSHNVQVCSTADAQSGKESRLDDTATVVDEVTPADESLSETDAVDDHYCAPLLFIPGIHKHLLWRKRVWAVCVAVIISLVIVGFVAGLSLSWVACGGGLLLTLLDWRDARPLLHNVDYNILVFFPGLFISVAGFNQTGVPAVMWNAIEPYAGIDSASGLTVLTLVIILLSNIASNVPTVLILGPRLAQSTKEAGGDVNMAWMILAFVSTVAGNALLVGSVANLIVTQRASEEYTLSFWNHLRLGLPCTGLVCLVGVPLIYVTYL